MAQVTLRAGDLTAVVGDNAAEGAHRAGYNGLWALTHRAEPTNLFVPAVAGLNLEHIVDGVQDDRDGSNRIFFEPRNAPMTLRRDSETVAELHQPPTPTFHLESWTRFTLAPPHYVDMYFRCRARQHAFQQGWMALFWASYVNAPADKSIYFRHGGLWHQLCTQMHNDESTLRHRDDRVELRFAEGYRNALYRNLSPLRYDEPFYYGQRGSMIALLMFDRTEGIRFTHSPSGGGVNMQRQTTNPAWDFQLVVPRVEVNREYAFRARLAYRPHCDRAAILQEVADWQRSLRGE